VIRSVAGPRVVVIGGGITGLVAARHLKAECPEASVSLLEGELRLGGKILTERVDGFVIDAGPEALIASRPRAIELCDELGLNERLVSPNPAPRGTSILARGRLRALPGGMQGMIPTRLGPLARSDLFSPLGKLRMALDLLIPPCSDEDETVASFVRRRLGREAYDRLVEPLTSGIYAGDPGQLSIAWTLPQLKQLERIHGGLIRGTLASRRQARRTPERTSPFFVAPRSGLSEIPEALERSLIEQGVEIRRGTMVISISAVQGGGYRALLEDGSSSEAAALIVATAAPAAAMLLQSIDSELAYALRGIPHVSTAIVALGYRQEHVAFAKGMTGYLTARSEGRAVRACTVVSEKWPERVPARMALLRLSLGGAGRDDVAAMDDDTLVRTAREELRDVVGISATPELVRVYRWTNAMPQYVVGHGERLADIEARLKCRWPGLAIAGNAYRGLGISDCVSSGERAAERVVEALHVMNR
jgi:protoporphyrinogen/coproporphyrinogen III oxidase